MTTEVAEKKPNMPYTTIKRSDFSCFSTHHLTDASPLERKELQDWYLTTINKGSEAWNNWALAFDRFITDNDLDRRLFKINLNNLTISQNDFNDFIFPVPVDFSKSIFRCSKVIEFAHATFKSNAHFTSTQFYSHVEFSNAEFFRPAYYNGTNFYSHAAFDGAKFKSIANFDECRFQSTSVFHCSIFLASASFCDVNFEGSAQFNEVSFHGDTKFRNSTFFTDSLFCDCDFHDNGDFSNAEFKQISDFRGKRRTNHTLTCPIAIL